MMRRILKVLVRVFLATWMIIAYFMIRNMELKHAADRNRKELTMELILFPVYILVGAAAAVVIKRVCQKILDRIFRTSTFTIQLLILSLLCFGAILCVFLRACSLLGEIWSLN